MTTRLKMLQDGSLVGVYSDQLAELGSRLGKLEVKRASNVEFDEASQEWVAVDNNGKEIARHKNRSEVLRQEVLVIEQQILNSEFKV